MTATREKLVRFRIFWDACGEAGSGSRVPMRSESWIGKFWARLRVGVIQDVPPGLDECEACREVHCTQERWLTCERRLRTEAANLAAACLGTGRTDELPSMPASEQPAAVPAESEENGDYARRRKISTH